MTDPHAIDIYSGRYSHADKMRELREARDILGMTTTQITVPKEQREWWVAMAYLSTHDFLMHIIQKGEQSKLELLANLRIKNRPKMSLIAGNLKERSETREGRLEVLMHENAVAQVRCRQRGDELLAEGNLDAALSVMAEEYALSMQLRGFEYLKQFWEKGLDDPLAILNLY